MQVDLFRDESYTTTSVESPMETEKSVAKARYLKKRINANPNLHGLVIMTNAQLASQEHVIVSIRFSRLQKIERIQDTAQLCKLYHCTAQIPNSL